MTANDQPMATPSTTSQTGGTAAGPVTEPVAPQQQMAQTQPIPSLDGTRGTEAARDHTAGDGDTHGAGPDAGLFADDDRVGLRSRWDALQASFVDDPKQCVQEADGLVEEVVQRLTASFAQARSRLDEQWSQGHDASTEDLRLALQRYRDFFQRLLTV